MPDFNPYHRWLGIPKHVRRPTANQILGVSHDEDDADAIAAAAVRQSAYVRNFQTGQYAAEAVRLLGEIEEAKITLLEEIRRSSSTAIAASESPEIEATIPSFQSRLSPDARGYATRVRRRRVSSLGMGAAVLASVALVGLCVYHARDTVLLLDPEDHDRTSIDGRSLRRARKSLPLRNPANNGSQQVTRSKDTDEDVVPQSDSPVDMGTKEFDPHDVAVAVNDGICRADTEPITEIPTTTTSSFTSAVYTITDLGTLGGANSRASSINNSGQIVGHADTSGNESHAFRICANGPMEDLGTLGGPRSNAVSINDHGEIVGFADNANGGSRAFLVSGNRRMRDIGTLGGRDCQAFAINNEGQVTGNSLGVGTLMHAFLYSGRGSLRDIHTLGAQQSYARGINNNGQVVGHLDFGGASNIHAFLYSNSEMIDLGTLGGSFSRASAINDEGRIIGQLCPIGSTALRGFLYDGSKVTDLGTLGGNDTHPMSINASGLIVGSSFITGGYDRNAGRLSGVRHAFIYEGRGPIQDLNDLIAPTSGWILLSATDVNDKGEIVGYGSVEGGTRAFLLTPTSVGTDNRSSGDSSPSHSLGRAVETNRTSALPDASETPESMLTAYLNDLSQWAIESGRWTKSDGMIIGSGDSRAIFKHDLPSDFCLEFTMNVLSGMRPRVKLRGFHFGNEGFSNTLFLHGVETTGTPYAYENGQQIRARLIIDNGAIQLFLDDMCVSTASIAAGEIQSLSLQGGDGFSAGSTAFSNFRLYPMHTPEQTSSLSRRIVSRTVNPGVVTHSQPPDGRDSSTGFERATYFNPSFNGRRGPTKEVLLTESGGTAQSEHAVNLGLAWLATHQWQDGGWRLNLSDGPCGGRCQDSGKVSTSTGATGLAVLAFLGAGHTHLNGHYRDVVTHGITYLRERAILTGRGADLREGTMYAHGIATKALCEAYGMTGDEELRQFAQSAVDFICSAQHSEGGWRYAPGQPGDTSVTGWQMMALRAASSSHLNIPPSVTARGERFLDYVQSGRGSYYGYQSRGRIPGPTAVGLLLRMYSGWQRDDDRLKRGIAFLAELGPSKHDMYFNYYATYVLHYFGGSVWSDWNDKMREYLIHTQDTTDHERGSWFFVDQHGSLGGRHYTTVMCVMILEVYYRNHRLYQKVAGN